MNALPSTYNGITYRSRTEARWAVFFTMLGMRFQYEPQGYRLKNGNYLPDFFIPAWNLYIEIKGKTATRDERLKCQYLAAETGSPVLLMIGPPDSDDGEVFFPGTLGNAAEVEIFDAALSLCRRCQAPMLSCRSADGYHPHPLYRCLSDIGCRETLTPALMGLEHAIATALNERFDVYPMEAA